MAVLDENGTRRTLELPEIAKREIPVPYPNPISREEQARIRRDICLYLIDNNIVNIDRLTELFDPQLTPQQWKEVSSNPQDYWYVVAGMNLVDQSVQNRLGRKLDFRNSDLQVHYNSNQWVWFGRAIELYELNNGISPSVETIVDKIISELAPIFRAFYVLKTGTNSEVNYLARGGDKYIQKYKRLVVRH